jgi:hypothetical protein
MSLEVDCRCYGSREGWHENVIIKAVSLSQGRRLTHNLTARLSRSVAVDYLLPHFAWHRPVSEVYFVGHWRLFSVSCILLDAVYAVRCILLDTLATVIYFVGHTGNCDEFVGHRRLFTVRCILLDTAEWGVFGWALRSVGYWPFSDIYFRGRCPFWGILLSTHR